jgi:hypothetical protein
LSGGSAYGIPKNWLIVLLSIVTVFPSTKPELVLTLTLSDSKHNEIPKVNTNNINSIIISDQIISNNSLKNKIKLKIQWFDLIIFLHKQFLSQ